MPGVEEWSAAAYRRTLRFPDGVGIVELRPPPPGAAHIEGKLWLSSPQDRADAIRRCRRLLDLDADPHAVDSRLAEDPVLAPLVAAAPGRRVPGAVDPTEMAVRAVLGQQVSTAAARTHAARLVVAYGEPVHDPGGGLTRLFPAVEALLDLDPAKLALPESRKRTLLGLLHALADGTVSLNHGTPAAGAEQFREQLLELPGFGPWTVETIAMRAFGDPDAFLAGDLGMRIAAEKLGLPTAPAALTARSRRWSPFRAYAVQHLWSTGGHAVNRLPEAAAPEGR